ncbi:cytoskeletal protein CcmA (bactofilin family) [Paenibacillus shirakamiensis]|uniref:Cytoskeletal protein CcmA (Bactofilin family) n=1 Tax=Paenibacillus shirakamiensis TaxID=1265935 RepID=A0ABS4JJ72_9BACL|nr:polymer-forming cytoskeletal protein [Paenibacillus shirakamiensis]MBP2001754.1 cytoskeletal protein CcmA (bactofilin family) [Paenibacillus shirakamiensis]
MREQALGDLRISGVGTYPGGNYALISIDGVGRVNGNLICEEIECNGTVKLRNVQVKNQMSVNGSGNVDGCLEGGSLRVDGMLKVRDEIRIDHLDINGMLTGLRGANGEKAEVNGSLKVQGDMQYEVIEVHGSLKVSGLLNAGTIHMELNGGCSAREIGVEQITVRKRGSLYGILGKITGKFSYLETDIIEGDDIDVEFTKARVIRGNRIRIGAGCEVDLVEYKESYEADPKSDVSRAVRV